MCVIVTDIHIIISGMGSASYQHMGVGVIVGSNYGTVTISVPFGKVKYLMGNITNIAAGGVVGFNWRYFSYSIGLGDLKTSSEISDWQTGDVVVHDRCSDINIFRSAIQTFIINDIEGNVIGTKISIGSINSNWIKSNLNINNVSYINIIINKLP